MLCQVPEEAVAEAADSAAEVREVPEAEEDPEVPEWAEVPEVPLPLVVGVPVGAVRADIGVVAHW